MSSKRVSKQSKFIRIINVPIRLLARARDLYMKSLTGFGGPVSYGNVMGCPTPHIPSVPRSFSVNSNQGTVEEKLRDLIRLGSTHRLEEAELRRSKSTVPLSGGCMAATTVSRSKTVAFGRIDEDKSYEHGEGDDLVLLGRAANYPRTRSYGGRSKKN